MQHLSWLPNVFHDPFQLHDSDTLTRQAAANRSTKSILSLSVPSLPYRQRAVLRNAGLVDLRLCLCIDRVNSRGTRIPGVSRDSFLTHMYELAECPYRKPT
jgi:hypothetical protein